MTVEQFAIQQINTLISGYDEIELEMYVDDRSFSIDFIVTVNGERKQCLDLIDEGVIPMRAYEAVSDKIVAHVRASEGYKSGSVNIYKTSSK